jgi:hypothetical protein
VIRQLCGSATSTSRMEPTARTAFAAMSTRVMPLPDTPASCHSCRIFSRTSALGSRSSGRIGRPHGSFASPAMEHVDCLAPIAPRFSHRHGRSRRGRRHVPRQRRRERGAFEPRTLARRGDANLQRNNGIAVNALRQTRPERRPCALPQTEPPNSRCAVWQRRLGQTGDPGRGYDPGSDVSTGSIPAGKVRALRRMECSGACGGRVGVDGLLHRSFDESTDVGRRRRRQLGDAGRRKGGGRQHA